jgi:hypothetical protein
MMDRAKKDELPKMQGWIYFENQLLNLVVLFSWFY